MKKFISFLLAAILLFAAIPSNVSSITAEATTANTMTISATDAVGVTGNTVTVDIRVSNNVGFVSAKVKVGYDASILKLIDHTAVDLTENISWGMLSANPFTVNWCNPLAPNAVGDKTLARLTFEVLDTAEAGAVTPITLTYDEEDVFNSDFINVPATVKAGSVTVKQHVTGVMLNKSTLSLGNGNSATLTATVSPANAHNPAVSWKSNNPAIATVDKNGKVTAVREGTATITVTTTDGGHTATCVVNVNCRHLDKTINEKIDSTCLKHGYAAFTYCNDCDTIIEGEYKELPLSSCKGGTATCVSKAICSTCKKTYGSLAAHKLTHHKGVQPTHFKNGNTEYWYCSGCKQYFKDSLGKVTTTYAATQIKQIPHTYREFWSYDDTEHWYACACGSRTNVHDHVYDDNCDFDCNDCMAQRQPPHVYMDDCDTDCEMCGAIRTVKHNFAAATCTKAKTCKICGETSGTKLGHTYTHNCDTTCNRKNCNYKRTISHKYTKVVTKAELTKDGKIQNKCTVCSYVSSKTTVIKRPTSFKLSTTTYTYNGSAKKPTVTVKDAAGKTIASSNYTVKYPSGRINVGTYKVTVTMKGNYSGTKTLTFKINPVSVTKCTTKLSTTAYTYNGGVKTPTVTVKHGSKTLKKNVDYTVTYASGRKNVGTYKVTIKMRGNYSGTKTLTFKVNPTATAVSKLTPASKSLKVTVGKKTAQVTGYQIQYSTSKSFSKASTKTLTKNTATSTTLSKLKAKTTYYVRVRTYKTVGSTKYYSGWSAIKYAKTK